MIDMQTMVRPLNYSTKGTLRVIKENCTPSLRIFLRAYKVSDLDTLVILADEYEELEKEREVFAQENKFSKTKSASTRTHEEITNGHHHTKLDDSRQQTHHAEAIGHHPHRNRDSQTVPCGGRQATHRGHKMPPISQTRRRPVENAVGTDTGLEDVETSGCYFVLTDLRAITTYKFGGTNTQSSELAAPT